MIQSSDQPKLNFMFQLQAEVTSKDNCKKGVICQSKNQKYLAFKYVHDIYLIEKNNETLLHLNAEMFDCCFSDDSKYFFLCFYKKNKFLLLYNLEEKQQIFIKKIKFLQQYTVRITINCYSNKIIILTNKAIEIFNLEGEEIFQLDRDFNFENRHVKLNDKLLIMSYGQFNHKHDSKTDFNLFSTQSYRNLKLYFLQKKYSDVFSVSQNLLIQVSSFSQQMMMRELISGKIIRKFLHPLNQDFCNICRKQLSNFELLSYEYDGYCKINLYEGNCQFYYFQFPIFVHQMLVNTLKELIFVQTKKIKVWKKNRRLKLLKIEFYEFLI